MEEGSPEMSKDQTQQIGEAQKVHVSGNVSTCVWGRDMPGTLSLLGVTKVGRGS